MCSKLLFYTIHTVSSYSALQIAEHVNPVLIILVCTINAFSNPCNPCNHKKLTLHPHTHLGLCGNATEGRRWGKKKISPTPTHAPAPLWKCRWEAICHSALGVSGQSFPLCGTYTVTVTVRMWYIHSYCCNAFLCVVHAQLPLQYVHNCVVHTQLLL